jgi:hypothetical protein
VAAIDTPPRSSKAVVSTSREAETLGLRQYESGVFVDGRLEGVLTARIARAETEASKSWSTENAIAETGNRRRFWHRSELMT